MFARWLERTGEGRDEYAGGEESELAALRARALAWFRRAAELTIGRFEIDDGLALLGWHAAETKKLLVQA